MKISCSIKILFVTIAIQSLIVSSCSKYEDGPKLSLRTKKSRLVGEWDLLRIDGQDVSDSVEFEFKKDLKFKMFFFKKYGGEIKKKALRRGDWIWKDDKESIELDVFNGAILKWRVKRLSNSELWFYDDDSMFWECEKKK